MTMSDASKAAVVADLRRLFLVLFWDDGSLDLALEGRHFDGLDEDEQAAAREVELLRRHGRLREDWLALRVARGKVNEPFFQALSAWAPGRRFLVQRVFERWTASEEEDEASAAREVVLFDPERREDHRLLARALAGLVQETSEIRALSVRAGIPWQLVDQGKNAGIIWEGVLWVASCRGCWPELRGQVLAVASAAEKELPTSL